MTTPTTPPTTPPTEAWLRGPLPDLAPELQPAAHALVQARDEIARAADGLTPTQLWVRPGDAASVGYHLRHAAGALDRLLTYARGEQLTGEQRAFLKAEGEPGDSAADGAALAAAVHEAVERALAQYRATPVETLGDAREVGRGKLPSTVRGLLFHAAEHTQRHAGQAITTAKIVRGLGLGADARLDAALGVGGIFFKARDADALRAWYREHLGVPAESWGAMFEWVDPYARDGKGMTTWSVFKADTTYFAPSTKEFMVNYRVGDLHATIARLRAAGVAVDEKVDESEYGRFGWAMDPEGNRFELWEPPGMRGQ
jgi:predicted enzyme related to lactoylglutathione lyase